jgi:hypothetical protein
VPVRKNRDGVPPFNALLAKIQGKGPLSGANPSRVQNTPSLHPDRPITLLPCAKRPSFAPGKCFFCGINTGDLIKIKQIENGRI